MDLEGAALRCFTTSFTTRPAAYFQPAERFFVYITVRTVVRELTSPMFLALAFGPSHPRLRDCDGQFIGRRPAGAQKKAGTPHDGRRPDRSLYAVHAALGRSHKPFHLTIALCTRRFRGYRLI